MAAKRNPHFPPELSDEATLRLMDRVGYLHLNQRQGIQRDHVTQIFGRGRNFFHIENWYSIHSLLRLSLRLVGLYGRGQRNARNIQLIHNEITIPSLPQVLQGYRLLHLSDLHLDMSRDIVHGLIERIRKTDYDLCVITGDFRSRTYGEYEAVTTAMAQLRTHIDKPVYAVLGNHDFIEMVPDLENLDMRILLNESVTIKYRNTSFYLAGIDDPHYYRADNLEKAAEHIPSDGVSILLSHSPEIFQHAAHAGFDLMLCGHTHGGQICLPGGTPITYNANCPRNLGRGNWDYHQLKGYTSVGAGSCVLDVRFNCPPEITLHHLQPA